MKILVINCGSSSLKFEFFKTGKELTSLAEGLIDRIGESDCKFTFKSSDKNLGIKNKVRNHTEAVKLTFDVLKKTQVLTSNKEIDLIAHRVVHGGEKYSKPTVIDAQVIKEIKKLSGLAPLHNPINLEGILACKKILPRTKQIAVFDTAFNQTMEEKAFMYAIPQEFYKKQGIRRYGFHGTNHQYVTDTATKLLGNKPNLKIISCHLGNGSSITASIGGKVVDTSMGFTPLEGIPMGSRSGSIDPAIILKIQEIKKLTPKRTDEFLNKECGLRGLSGISSDMREIYDASLKKDKNAILTIDLLSYQIAKYIGAYSASLNGLDALIFTGGMGEKAFYIREKACSYLNHLGLILEKFKNQKNEQMISDRKSKIKVFVIKADEEYQIAKSAISRQNKTKF
jgi:acetate kinase